MACLAAVVLLSTACTSAPRASPGPLRIVASWTGQELVAFQSALGAFEARTGATVEYVETRDLEGTIARELASGNPIDLAGLTGPAHMASLARAGSLRDLRDAIDVGAYKAAVAPTFIDLGTVDGHLVGAFIKSTAKGLMWFSPKVYNLGTPVTWSDLQRVAGQGARGSARPWCVGLESKESSGWPGTDWIEEVLLRTYGPQVYDDWTAGRLPWTSTPVHHSFQAFGSVVADGQVAGGSAAALSTNFADAGDPLFTTPPGCLFLNQGSFMPVFFTAKGRVPSADFDFFPFPEITPAYSGALMGGGDLVGLLSDRDLARQLMAFLVSREGQDLLVRSGFGLSVNSGVRSYPNDVAVRAAALLTNADHFRFDASDLMPRAMSSAFMQAVLEFTAHPDRLDELLTRLDTTRRTAYGG